MKIKDLLKDVENKSESLFKGGTNDKGFIRKLFGEIDSSEEHGDNDVFTENSLDIQNVGIQVPLNAKY